MGQKSLLLSLLILLLSSNVVFAQTGRIDGTVVEQGTENPLPGVNVIIEGESKGAQTNVDGYYSINNVLPGTYTLRASFIGFAPVVVNNVEVNINEVTRIDIELREEVIEGEEIVVRAVAPVVQRDVSSSRANIRREDIENLPITSVNEAIGLQAGVQGLTVRGGSSDQLGFTLNGLSLRDERDNTPITSISLTSVESIQVQTGGFNAEYGNIRSGLIQVTSKEGDAEKYEADAIIRYRPPQDKHFGPSINNPDSYWIRPYVDDDVAWVGTDNGTWDKYTRENYETFVGWDAIADQFNSDGDPSTDITPEGAQQAFLWQHRKEFGLTEPDYDIDLTVSGPVPVVSSYLGDLRFSASVKETQSMYTVPLSRDRYIDRSLQFRLTSNLQSNMKLSLNGLLGEQTGTNSNNSGLPGIFSSTQQQTAQMERVSFIRSRIYSTDYWAPTRRTLSSFGAKLTHTLGSNTFYDLSINRVQSQYSTNPGRLRNTDPVVFFADRGFDEAPFGFFPDNANGIGSGMRMGVGMSTSRDSSSVATYTGKFDITSQLNQSNQVKAGIELVLSNHEVNYARIEESLPTGNVISKWSNSPLRGAAYVQNRLEFRGMIANLGLRLDYSNPRTEWIEFDRYTDVFAVNGDRVFELLETEKPDVQLTLSPRMGISFPINEDSKLFFNYGHFYSMPDPENLFMVRVRPFDNTVARVANPNNPLPKTVAYELGYEHNLFDLFLARISGYYRDTSQQPAQVEYIGRQNQPRYTISEPFSYQDTRGAEFTLRKVAGRYVRGEINYTYSITSGGLFGTLENYELANEQRDYERNQGPLDNAQFRPVPRPFARLYVDFLAPSDLGPEIGGFYPLGNWTLSTIGRWQKGVTFTWSGGGPITEDVLNNVTWKDVWSFDTRLSRKFSVAGTRNIDFFVDVSNVLNLQRMNFFTNAGFVDGQDYRNYMESLHLPESVVSTYTNADNVLTGNDRPGDYRDFGIDYVPIETTSNLANVQDASGRALYWVSGENQFYQFVDGEFVNADMDFVNQVLDDKAYINMPNQNFFTFFNPRAFQFGIKVSF